MSRVTPQDWRVTASQEAERCVDLFAEARGADLDAMVEVLQRYGEAYRSAGAAVGALVYAEVADGSSWAEVATAVGLPPDEVQVMLEPVMAEALRRLRLRLDDS